jgi:hypothetical protein
VVIILTFNLLRSNRLLQSFAKDRLIAPSSEEPASHPTKICKRCDVTYLIHYLLPKIGRRLAPEVVYRIRVRIKASKEVPAIAKAIDMSYPTVYKIQLNLNLYSEPYALASLIQGRPRLLLAY